MSHVYVYVHEDGGVVRVTIDAHTRLRTCGAAQGLCAPTAAALSVPVNAVLWIVASCLTLHTAPHLHVGQGGLVVWWSGVYLPTPQPSPAP